MIPNGINDRVGYFQQQKGWTQVSTRTRKPSLITLGALASVVFVQIEIDHLEETEVLRKDDQEDQHQDPAQDEQEAPAVIG